MNHPIVLLDLSDIHFYEFQNGHFDLNEELRNELERDVRRLVPHVGTVEGIVVTGDVAFSGKTAEYEIAGAWLEKLSQITKSAPENVWAIPGNHDIDRSVIEASMNIPEMQTKLRSHLLTSGQRNEMMLRYLAHTDGEQLFLALANFNRFAQPFGCETSRAEPCWEHDLVLNDGSYLRLRGINSAIVSNSTDDNVANKLIVTENQSLPMQIDGVTYMTLCHHPPDWLCDADDVARNLYRRSKIQLFGHKHHFDLHKIDDSLVVSAGAVHPSRTEADWQPRYNFLSLQVTGGRESRILQVKVWSRVYREVREFQADYAPSSREEYQERSLKLPEWDGITLPARRTGTLQISAARDSTGQAHQAESGLSPVSEEGNMDHERRLAYRFFSLPYPDIIQIAVNLKLLTPEDGNIPEGELLNRFYTRAKSDNRLSALWDQVEDVYRDGQDTVNPFQSQ